MSDEVSLIPAILARSDAEAIKAVAELGNSVIGIVKDAGQAISSAIGDAPKNAFGILTDHLATARAIGAIRLQKKIEEERERLGIEDPQPASPSIAQPLLEAALNETREDLQDVWARLIVTATDPKRAHLVRKNFIDTLKQFDPYDALVLRQRQRMGDGPFSPNVSIYDNVSNLAEISQEDVYLSVDHLAELGCAEKSGVNPHERFILTRFGKALLRACSD